jgi:hypothetical protein
MQWFKLGLSGKSHGSRSLEGTTFCNAYCKKREIKIQKSTAYKSLIHPILKYGAACWDPYRECKINSLDCIQNNAAKFVHLTGGLDWESLVQGRKIAHMYVLFKAYTGERAWGAIAERLQAPSYLSRVDHNWKIRARKQRNDTSKYSFVNRTIADWNHLTGGDTGSHR